MKLEIVVPSSGESVSEADIAKWLKDSGDVVKMDEPILELETEKASLEITAEVHGRLEILEQEGSTVKVGQVIGYLEPIDEKKIGSGEETDPKDDRKSLELTGITKLSKGSGSGQLIPPSEIGTGIPSPAAKKIMADHGISPKDVKATGKGGRITKGDVFNFLEEQNLPKRTPSAKKKYVEFYNPNSPAISPDETVTLIRQQSASEIPNDYGIPSEISASGKNNFGSEGPVQSPIPSVTKDSVQSDETGTDSPIRSRNVRREKLSRLRKTIARHLVDAQQNAALLTTFNEVDMSAIIDVRKKYKAEFKDTHNINLGFMSFFTKAACQALFHYPIVNSQMDESNIFFFDYCDIGIAVSTDKGLVVPIVRNAESMSFNEIEYNIEALANKGRRGELTLDDLSGGTFTITNGGVFGSMLSTPIVNRPQSAVLGMHNIVERPVARDGQVVIKPMMYLALTYDHRLIDGADAVKFLIKIKTLCEDPIKMVLNL